MKNIEHTLQLVPWHLGEQMYKRLKAFRSVEMIEKKIQLVLKTCFLPLCSSSRRQQANQQSEDHPHPGASVTSLFYGKSSPSICLTVGL